MRWGRGVLPGQSLLFVVTYVSCKALCKMLTRFVWLELVLRRSSSRERKGDDGERKRGKEDGKEGGERSGWCCAGQQCASYLCYTV